MTEIEDLFEPCCDKLRRVSSPGERGGKESVVRKGGADRVLRECITEQSRV